MTSLLQRGCIKSVQFINQWVKPTLSAPDDRQYCTSTIQVNINQVNAAKSIVLFNGINSFSDNSDPSVLSHIKYYDTRYNIDSIENYIDNINSNNRKLILFELTLHALTILV